MCASTPPAYLPISYNMGSRYVCRQRNAMVSSFNEILHKRDHLCGIIVSWKVLCCCVLYDFGYIISMYNRLSGLLSRSKSRLYLTK